MTCGIGAFEGKSLGSRREKNTNTTNHWRFLVNRSDRPELDLATAIPQTLVTVGHSVHGSKVRSIHPFIPIPVRDPNPTAVLRHVCYFLSSCPPLVEREGLRYHSLYKRSGLHPSRYFQGTIWPPSLLEFAYTLSRRIPYFDTPPS